ncbi:MAG: protein translocase subunit SecDF, partial [Bacteroidota bacterium]
EKFRAANPFLGMFNLMTPMDPARPVVGYARTTDTARINNFLAHPEAIAITPTDVRFLWEIYPDRHMVVQPTNGEPPLLGLIAIKTNRENRPPLSGQSITHARQDFDSYNNSPIINIEMNAEGALIWERLTRSNIGKCIAIVLDDHVYSYPTVQGAITGGRSQISGQFTVEEARDLAVVLRAGALPIKLTVIEATVY